MLQQVFKNISLFLSQEDKKTFDCEQIFNEIIQQAKYMTIETVLFVSYANGGDLYVVLHPFDEYPIHIKETIKDKVSFNGNDLTGYEEDLLYDFFEIYDDLILQKKYSEEYYVIEIKFNNGTVEFIKH